MMACPHWSPVLYLGSPRGLWHRDTNLRVLVTGVILGWGAAVRVLLAACTPSPCSSKFLREPETFPLRGLGPPRTERVWGVASLGRSGPGEVLFTIFGSGGPESVYASQSAPSEIMGSFGTEPQQVVVSWFSLLITRSWMHAIYLCVEALAEDLEAPALKSNAQTKTPGNTP